MSTWLELKQRTFTLLDLPANTSGDVEGAVENRLQERLEQIAQSLKLPDLLVETTAVDLIGPATSLNLTTDFSITDLQEIYAVRVDRDPDNADSTFEAWDEMSYGNYVKAVSPKGDRRPGFRFVYNRSSEDLLFTSVPQSAETWEVKVVYYKQIAAYNDSNSPELPVDHHHLLPYGAALMMPHYFAGDRQALLSTYGPVYSQGIKRLQAEMRDSASFRTRTSRVRRGSGGSIRWGSV